MINLNNVTVIGNLTKTPELKEGNSTKYCFITIAVNQKYKEKDSDEWKTKTDFIPATLFGYQAESICKYCIKGQQVMAISKLSQSEVKDKFELKFIVRKIEFGVKPQTQSAKPEIEEDIDYDLDF